MSPMSLIANVPVPCTVLYENEGRYPNMVHICFVHSSVHSFVDWDCVVAVENPMINLGPSIDIGPLTLTVNRCRCRRVRSIAGTVADASGK